MKKLKYIISILIVFAAVELFFNDLISILNQINNNNKDTNNLSYIYIKLPTNCFKTKK